MNVIKYPTPDSILFWDMIVLNGYLILNILIGWNVLESERHDVPPPHWVKTFYVSIPWAVSIHTVTAFLYAGLPGRGYWLTAVMAPRFLASAFCAGPALLILLCLLVRKISKFDPGKEQIQTLAKIVTYALLINVFFCSSAKSSPCSTARFPTTCCTSNTSSTAWTARDGWSPSCGSPSSA